MSRFVYVDGHYLRYAEAGVHVEDRGFQFSDAVYEVVEVSRGGLVDEARHLDRLDRSLHEIEIPAPMSRAALSRVLHETRRRNRVTNGWVYLQITRGQARREFTFPAKATRPTVVSIARAVRPDYLDALAARGIAVKTMADIRWARRDIKTVMLLPACLARQSALREDAQEAWFVDDGGFVTEGAASNAWIVSDGRLVTRQADRGILSGITRATLMSLIARENIVFEERPFQVDEAKRASEAFISAATRTVMPVVRIDDTVVGNGRPGPVASRLRLGFREEAIVTKRPLTG